MKQIAFKKMSSAPCAVCHSEAHKGYLTVKAVKEHNCLGKNCPSLQKLEHDYWTQVERKKLEKKYMKLAVKLGECKIKDEAWQKVKSMRLDELRLEVKRVEEIFAETLE